MRLRLLPLALVLWAGCGSPREVAEPPLPPAYGAVSSVHYRDFASADALAEFFRWRPGAPVLVSALGGGPAPGLPENALATFEYALNFAPVLIETTVRQAADGTLVLFHDETLDRTTTGSGLVTDHPLAALRAVYLLDPTGAPTPHRIPTLAEALAWAEGRAVLVLDPEGVPPEDLAAALRAADAGDRVVVVTDAQEEAQRYLRLAPDLVYGVAGAQTALLSALPSTGPAYRLAFLDTAGPDAVARLHALGLRVRAAPAGPEAYRPLLDAGVDVLATTDVPAAARAALGRSSY